MTQKNPILCNVCDWLPQHLVIDLIYLHLIHVSIFGSIKSCYDDLETNKESDSNANPTEVTLALHGSVKYSLQSISVTFFCYHDIPFC